MKCFRLTKKTDETRLSIIQSSKKLCLRGAKLGICIKARIECEVIISTSNKHYFASEYYEVINDIVSSSHYF